MAKKDELLKNKNNETEAVSDDKPLEKKAVEELQEELSSVFNEDYDETEEDDVWEDAPEGFSLFPFLRKERYGNYPEVVEEKEETPKEKKDKRPVFPWKKKSEKDIVEKEEITKEETETETVEENVEETKPVIEDKEVTLIETTDEASVIEEKQDEIVEKIEEEQEKKAEEIPAFEEEQEEVTEEDKNVETVKEETTETPAKKKFGLPVFPWTLKKNKAKNEEVQEEPSLEKADEKVEVITPFEESVEEKKEEIIEELPSFEQMEKEDVIEEKEEVVEEISTPEIVEEVENEENSSIEETPLVEEEIKEEVIEVLPPFEEVKVEEKFEELPPFKPVETEETVESVDTSEEKTDYVKPAKQKKEKKAKKEKIQQIDDEPLTKKDHITFVLAIVALVLAVAFVFFKFYPMSSNGGESPESNIETGAKLSEIQVIRQSTGDKYIQSDSENIYYSVSSGNEVKYFECENGATKPIQATGTVNAQITMDKEKLLVTINYVKTGDGIFGISIFRSEDNPGSTLHNVITFKLIDLPEKHKADGKALLLAVANSESASRRYNLWTDSFIVDLKTGTTTRFLTADKNSNLYSVAYSVLTNSAYVTDGDMIPFFTTRGYGDGSGKKDLYVKNGAKESLFATDVYGEYIYADKDVIAYLKATETGFNVVKKENTKEEKVVFSLYGNFSTDYLYHGKYILNKQGGNLYNAKTGEEIALAGYKMSNAEMMSISPDGRYLVVLGTVNSVADYQVHIFDLKKNDYAKYEELNFSQHYNLSFVDETKAMYVVVDPNGGYEHVVFDVSKAF